MPTHSALPACVRCQDAAEIGQCHASMRAGWLTHGPNGLHGLGFRLGLGLGLRLEAAHAARRPGPQRLRSATHDHGQRLGELFGPLAERDVAHVAEVGPGRQHEQLNGLGIAPHEPEHRPPRPLGRELPRPVELHEHVLERSPSDADFDPQVDEAGTEHRLEGLGTELPLADQRERDIHDDRRLGRCGLETCGLGSGGGLGRRRR